MKRAGQILTPSWMINTVPTGRQGEQHLLLLKKLKFKQMKRLLFIFTLLLTLTSCDSKKEEPVTDLSKLISNRAVIQQNIDSLATELKKIDVRINKLDTLKKLQKVTIMTVKDTLFNHYIALQGMVKSDQNVILRPEMGGTVQRMLVKEGQRVNKGQTLVKLDASSFSDKIDELNTQLSLAKTSFDRQERLWNQKIGSEMQYLNAKTQKEGLEKSLNSVYTQIEKMKIKAPFSGVIDEIHSKVGELTGSQTSVLRLINLNKMYIEADVPEAYLTSVKKGTNVLINFVAINKLMEARITEIGNYINPDNRSFRIKININNKDHSVKPNLLADIQINDFSGNGVVLPANLIQMNQKGEKFVFSVVKDSLKTSVVKKIVTLGKEYNNQVFLINGLKSSEKIVKDGGKFVKNGDEVEVTNFK